MKTVQKNVLAISCFLFMAGCAALPHKKPVTPGGKEYKQDTVTYFDPAGNRKIPVAFFTPAGGNSDKKIPIIFSHGYGQNKGGDYLVYNYITEFLASKGYFVASIQHELPTDDLLAMTGNLHETRMPNWQRGAQNIYFVLQEMKKNFPQLHYKKLVVMGHSNGGDMSVLFTKQHPELVDKLISLDNRRMELPRTAHPKIFTIRSIDQPADPGVLPDAREEKKFGITVLPSAVMHNNMDDDANPAERVFMDNKILEFLQK